MPAEPVCRACEAAATSSSSSLYPSAPPPLLLLDLGDPANRTLLRKLRSCIDTYIDIDDARLPRHLCADCAASVEAAHRFRIRCEYTEQKWRDALLTSSASASASAEILRKADDVEHEGTDAEILLDIEVAQLVEDVIVLGEGAEQNTLNAELIAYEDAGEVEPSDEQLNDEDAEYIDYDDNDDDDDDNDSTEEDASSAPPETVTISSSHAAANPKPRNSLTIIRPHQCPDCGKAFAKRYQLTNHRTIHSPSAVRFSCPICGKLYSNAGNRDRHVRVYHQQRRQYTCDACGKSFSQSGILKQHQAVHVDERNFACDRCEKRFKTREYLQLHRNRHVRDIGSGDAAADQRPKNFISQTTTNIQESPAALRKKRRTLRHNGDDGPATATHLHICTFCSKQSTTAELHVAHMRTHTGEKPYECAVCHKRFSFQQSLKTHRLQHTGEKPFRCDECGLRFRQIGHLIGHRLTHSGRRQHECPFCAKAFALRGNLTVHMRLHTGETPYRCAICAKKFNDSNGLKRHWQSHVRNGDVEANDSADEADENELHFGPDDADDADAIVIVGVEQSDGCDSLIVRAIDQRHDVHLVEADCPGLLE